MPLTPEQQDAKRQELEEILSRGDKVTLKAYRPEDNLVKYTKQVKNIKQKQARRIRATGTMSQALYYTIMSIWSEMYENDYFCTIWDAMEIMFRKKHLMRVYDPDEADIIDENYNEYKRSMNVNLPKTKMDRLTKREERYRNKAKYRREIVRMKKKDKGYEKGWVEFDKNGERRGRMGKLLDSIEDAEGISLALEESVGDNKEI